MTTRGDAVAAAGHVQAETYRLMETLPAPELARRAYTPGGLTVEELEREIRTWRRDPVPDAA